ncbi:MAG: hypothetical protein V1820_04510 [archaeon]
MKLSEDGDKEVFFLDVGGSNYRVSVAARTVSGHIPGPRRIWGGGIALPENGLLIPEVLSIEKTDLPSGNGKIEIQRGACGAELEICSFGNSGQPRIYGRLISSVYGAGDSSVKVEWGPLVSAADRGSPNEMVYTDSAGTVLECDSFMAEIVGNKLGLGVQIRLGDDCRLLYIHANSPGNIEYVRFYPGQDNTPHRGKREVCVPPELGREFSQNELESLWMEMSLGNYNAVCSYSGFGLPNEAFENGLDVNKTFEQAIAAVASGRENYLGQVAVVKPALAGQA